MTKDIPLQGGLQGLKVAEYKSVHTDWVKQVAYYNSLRSFVSSSRCNICSLLVSDLTTSRIQYKFKVNMGVSCFTLCEGAFNRVDAYFHTSQHIFITLL